MCPLLQRILFWSLFFTVVFKHTLAKTVICTIVDESSSMTGKESAVIDGLNSFIADQKQIKGDAAYYFIKFNDNVRTIYNNIPLNRVSSFTRGHYTPSGSTALYDAIAEGMKILENNVKPGDRVVCIIFTDGLENASKQADEAKVKKFFAKFQSLGNWAFVYIGEKSQEFAAKMGIPPENAIDFRHGDVASNFRAASVAATKFRKRENPKSLLADTPRTEEEEEKSRSRNGRSKKLSEEKDRGAMRAFQFLVGVIMLVLVYKYFGRIVAVILVVGLLYIVVDEMRKAELKGDTEASTVYLVAVIAMLIYLAYYYFRWFVGVIVLLVVVSYNKDVIR